MNERKKGRRGKGNEVRRQGRGRRERGQRGVKEGKKGRRRNREIATGCMNPPLHLPSS